MTIRFRRHHGTADREGKIEPEIKVLRIWQGTYADPKQVELSVTEGIPQHAQLQMIDRDISNKESTNNQRGSADQGVTDHIRASSLHITKLQASIGQGLRKNGKLSGTDA